MRWLLQTCLLLICFFVSGQKSWMGLSIGANNSQIRYVDSSGNVDENLKGVPSGAASLLFQTQISDKGKKIHYPATTLLSSEIGYKSTKIKDKESALLTTWSLHYFTGNLTIRRKANSNKRVNPFYGGGVVMDWFIGGTQTLGFEQYDLKHDLETINLSITGEVGLTYFIGMDAYGTLGLGYLRGISNLEKSVNEKALLHSIKISLAVFFGF